MPSIWSLRRHDPDQVMRVERAALLSACHQAPRLVVLVSISCGGKLVKLHQAELPGIP